MKNTANIKGFSPSFSDRLGTAFTMGMANILLITLLLLLIYWGEIPDTEGIIVLSIAFILGARSGWNFDQSEDRLISFDTHYLTLASKKSKVKIAISTIINIVIDRHLNYDQTISHINLHIYYKGTLKPISINQWQSDTCIFEFSGTLSQHCSIDVVRQRLFQRDPGYSFETIELSRIYPELIQKDDNSLEHSTIDSTRQKIKLFATTHRYGEDYTLVVLSDEQCQYTKTYSTGKAAMLHAKNLALSSGASVEVDAKTAHWVL